MHIFGGALRPRNEAPRQAHAGAERGTAIFITYNAISNSFSSEQAQCPAVPPRIIATHWLRADTVEGANG